MFVDYDDEYSSDASGRDDDASGSDRHAAAAAKGLRVGELLRCLKLNFVLRAAPGVCEFGAGADLLEQELACRYRVPHVRAVVRTRVMCQAGRCRAAGGRRGGRGSIMAWLCERAPLWVVVHVCALLQEGSRK